VRLTVLPHDGRHRLVEERQVEVFNVTSSNSASVRLFAISWTHLATASPLRPGRVLPRMMAILSAFIILLMTLVFRFSISSRETSIGEQARAGDVAGFGLAR